MGLIGYTIKLVHIPINNIIVYAPRQVDHDHLSFLCVAVVLKPAGRVHLNSLRPHILSSCLNLKYII
jgi:hypothetical protein